MKEDNRRSEQTATTNRCIFEYTIYPILNNCKLSIFMVHVPKKNPP